MQILPRSVSMEFGPCNSSRVSQNRKTGPEHREGQGASSYSPFCYMFARPNNSNTRTPRLACGLAEHLGVAREHRRPVRLRACELVCFLCVGSLGVSMRAACATLGGPGQPKAYGAKAVHAPHRQAISGI